MIQTDIPLISGQHFTLVWSWTFGEAAIFAALILIITLYCARWAYDLAHELWRTSKLPTWFYPLVQRMAQFNSKGGSVK